MTKFFRAVEKRENGKRYFLVFDGLNPEQILVFREPNASGDILYLQISGSDKEIKAFKAQQITEIKEIKEAEFLDALQFNAEYLGYIGSRKERRENAEKALIGVLIIEDAEVAFQINKESLNTLNHHITLANARFNQEFASGKSLEEASAVYEKAVAWKAEDNAFYDITIAQMLELTESALSKYQELLEKQ